MTGSPTRGRRSAPFRRSAARSSFRYPAARRRRSVRAAAGLEEDIHEVRSAVSAIGAVLRTLVDYGTDVPVAQRRRFLALALLELDRLERRVAPKRPEPRAVHDVNGLIEPSVALRRLAGQEVHWAPRDLRVVCVRDPVVEVLNGLLANAAAHAPGAPVWITADAVGSRVQIVVRDGGPGVPSAVRGVVFERGRRGARSTGQGIGLWVAARLIEEQSGTLRLLPNTPGEGAAFAITLPLAGPAVAP